MICMLNTMSKCHQMIPWNVFCLISSNHNSLCAGIFGMLYSMSSDGLFFKLKIFQDGFLGNVQYFKIPARLNLNHTCTRSQIPKTGFLTTWVIRVMQRALRTNQCFILIEKLIFQIFGCQHLSSLIFLLAEIDFEDWSFDKLYHRDNFILNVSQTDHFSSLAYRE